MKIRQLIAELDKIYAEHGDIEVRYSAEHGDERVDQVIVSTNRPEPPRAVLI